MSKEIDNKRKLIGIKNNLVKTKGREAVPIKLQRAIEKRGRQRKKIADKEFDSGSDRTDRMDVDPTDSERLSRLSEISQRRVRERSMSWFKDEKVIKYIHPILKQSILYIY